MSRQGRTLSIIPMMNCCVSLSDTSPSLPEGITVVAGRQRLARPIKTHRSVTAEWMQITHGLPKLERPQHIATDVDVARQVRVGELDMIKTRDCAHHVPIV